MNKLTLYESTSYLDFKRNIYDKSDKTCVCCKKKKENIEILIQVKKESIKDDSMFLLDYEHKDLELICQECYQADLTTPDPQSGWTLLSLVAPYHGGYNCERIKENGKRCNKAIKDEFNIFHPKVGYRIVGSTCIQNLTEDDKILSTEILEYYNKIKQNIKKLNEQQSIRGWKYRKFYGKDNYQYRIDNKGHKYGIEIRQEPRGQFSIETNRNMFYIVFKNIKGGKEFTRIYSDKEKIIKLAVMLEFYFKSKKLNSSTIQSFMKEAIKQPLKDMGFKFTSKTEDKRKATFTYKNRYHID